ncbi:MAG: HNH endonuclease [Eubacteriales bacterium]|nr:HNH endonuclease [Eubacteriales bacterium]
MPPATVKTVKDTIFWQYAGLMTEAAVGRRDDWGLRMSFLNKLRSGEIVWSTAVREWLLEQENPSVCIYCGAEGPLTVEHILSRSRGGEDVPENVVRVCRSCNSGKGAKGLYEWKGLDAKNSHHRIAEGKYLKYLYTRHENAGTLDKPLAEICPCCLQPKCAQEGHAHKLTVYCIEGYFAPKGKTAD